MDPVPRAAGEHPVLLSASRDDVAALRDAYRACTHPGTTMPPLSALGRLLRLAGTIDRQLPREMQREIPTGAP